MNDKELLKAFKEYRTRAGRAKAISELTAKEVCPRTAEDLCGDDYKRSPSKKTRRAIEEIVKKAS